jgi:hypothetical protein
VSLALKKTMTPVNIRKWFLTTCIWPLHQITMDDDIGQTRCFEEVLDEKIA